MSHYEEVGDDVEMGTELTPQNVSGETIPSYDYVVYFIVPKRKLRFFKAWLAELYELVVTFKGFVTRSVHELEQNEEYGEIVMITVFDSFSSFRNWHMFQTRRDKYITLAKQHIKWTALNDYGGISKGDQGPNGEKASAHRILDQNAAIKVPKPRSPPKWKLTLVLILSIYMIVACFIYSEQSVVFLEAGLPRGFITLIYVCELVIINVFALSRIVMDIPLVSKWIRLPRPTAEQMSPIHRVLDQGLEIFADKNSAPLPPDLVQWMDKMEGKVSALRRKEHEMKVAMQTICETVTSMREHLSTQSLSTGSGLLGTVPVTNGIAIRKQPGGILNEKLIKMEDLISVYRTRSPPIGGASPSPDPSDTSGNGCQNDIHSDIGSCCQQNIPSRICMAVRHYVKWEYVLEFEAWTDEMETEMRRWPGFLGLVKLSPRQDGDPYIMSFAFQSIETLMAFSKSTNRQELLVRLDPMLEATSSSIINDERTLSDGFSELFVPTGGAAKRRPPPLWKTCTLAIIPLTIIVWQVGGAIDPYLIDAGLENFLYTRTFIKLCINICINNYVGVPVMYSLFGSWLHTPRPVKSITYIRFLEVGLLKVYRYLLVAVYMASCIVPTLVASY
jgi:antibiotic biosynthesis monooxygenase (ABM) superfamily enzyme